MKIKDLAIYPYSFDLCKPILIRDNSLSKREGLILCITDELGHKKFGDIAPLPYFHHETLSEMQDLFCEIKPKLLGTHWSLRMLLEGDHILADLLKDKEASSLQYAIEIALLNHLTLTSSHQNVPINALLIGEDEEILNKAKTLQEYSRIKVKVSNRSPLEMLDLIDKLKPCLTRHQKLRIDVNRFWNRDEAEFFSERIDPDLLDYLEEPLKNPLELLEFSSKSPHPIAFDESLLDTPLNFLLSIPTKKALIIKPALIGSISKIYKLYEKAQFHKLQFILTSVFESGLGHLSIAQLAQFFDLRDPIGLDTYQWIKKDVLSKTLVFQKGALNLKESYAQNPYIDSKFFV